MRSFLHQVVVVLVLVVVVVVLVPSVVVTAVRISRPFCYPTHSSSVLAVEAVCVLVDVIIIAHHAFLMKS